MSILTRLFRCVCLCVVFERGSWNPQQKAAARNKSQLKSRFKETEAPKKGNIERPEWLKEWTISKGWVHNRSHLLNLGRGNMEEEDESSDSSSVSNVDDLISIENNVYEHEDEEISQINLEGPKQPSNQPSSEIAVIEDEASSPTIDDIPTEDISLIFQEISQNYRHKFPENRSNYNAFQLPEIYKEKILKSETGQNLFLEIWKHVKLKRRKRNSYNCKFTVNKLYNEGDVNNLQYKKTDTFKLKRNSYGRNIAIHNTLNSRTNLHEDPIYECSEESMCNNSLGYIYYNPIYSPEKISRNENESNSLFLKKIYPRKQISLRYDSNSGLPLRTEKYVIRHVRIRIMLSLRLGKTQKVNKNKKDFYRRFLWKRNSNDRQENPTIQYQQKKIEAVRSSSRNQNTRGDRLDVLRWLLWEQRQMPGLRDGAPAPGVATHAGVGTPPAGGTLALHYAAARGCLDCVRLLVDSTPDLSANTQMDNDVTPVYLAAQEGHLDVLKFLVLEAGGSLYVRAKDGMAPIHAASQMGCLNCVKWMIQDQGVDPNLRDGDGATPLHFSASRGHLDTVRWLLKHGARLSLDKFGKSPINDAAENQQVECLNVLVQHGASPDYQDSVTSSRKKSCSCSRRGSDQSKRGKSDTSDCSSCKSRSLNSSMEPFYLHPPISGTSIEAAHAPENGLYINPMNNHRHSISSCSERSFNGNVSGESFYLHNPQEVIYNRVKDLFETANATSSLSALTVKVEVHSTSSGAGSDENLSCSDLSERSADHDHDYEDIYIVREESKGRERTTCRSRSRDSGSHSRSGSISSSASGCNVVVKLTKTNKSEATKITNGDHMERNQISEQHEKYKSDENNFQTNNNEEQQKTKLGTRRSLPPANNNHSINSKVLKRVISVPVGASPPPPPPPPPLVTNPTFQITPEDDEPRGATCVEIVEEPTLKPSEILKGMCRSMSALTARRLNASCSDLTSGSLVDDLIDRHSGGPNLVNKQRVLPFVPPSFPGNITGSNHLIKPSEYLRSISDKHGGGGGPRGDTDGVTVTVEESREFRMGAGGPPPPPLPEFNTEDQTNGPTKMFNNEKNNEEITKSQQPLSAISIQDLNSVQLRRTDKMLATKTFSAPTRSMSLQCLNQAESYVTQKIDLIAELKMSKDITGIKKMKIEKAKTDVSKDKEILTEISKQFTATNFVDKIPDKDNSGNMIPAWKRQMLAKKAAEKAKKELEEQLLREAEEKRLQAIPPWKRQLLAKKEEAENKIKSTLYTPKVVDDKAKKLHGSKEDLVESCNEDINNNEVESMNEANKDENENNVSDGESTMIIPWRAQLRKTNSKLNILD